MGGLVDNAGGNTNTILELDTENEIWIQREEILAESKQKMAAMLVPDDIVNCDLGATG